MAEATEWKSDFEGIEKVLVRRGLDEVATEEICSLLQKTADEDRWAAPLLLFLLDQPAISGALQDEEAPEKLVRQISRALHGCLDIFQEWTGAPLLIQLERFKREYRREQNLYDRVRRRLEEQSEERALTTMERYLERSNSSYFTNCLELEFPDLVAKLDGEGDE